MINHAAIPAASPHLFTISANIFLTVFVKDLLKMRNTKLIKPAIAK